MATEKNGRFKMVPHINASGTQSWKVDGSLPGGKRLRKYFITKEDAMRELADLELQAVGKNEMRRLLRTVFDSEELADAEAAAQHAKPLKLSKVVAHYMSLLDRLSPMNIKLDEAMAFVEARYSNESKAISILNAKNEYMKSKESLSDATRANYDHGIGQLLKRDPNKLVHAFTLSDIEMVLQRYSNLNTRKTLRRVISVFFNWCARHHYCSENPCDRLDRLQRDMSQIVALSLVECKRLLYAAILHENKAMTACIAIGLFAGLRPSEIKDLKPEDIVKDKIKVSGGKLRRKLKRSTPIPPVLTAWLKEFPFTGIPAGWASKFKRLKKATKAKKWASDIIRHSSLTFQTERDKDEARTAFHCGTSVAMLNMHYRDIVDDEQIVAEFWSLTPAKLRAKPPKVNLIIKRLINWPTKAKLSKLVWAKPLIHAAKDIGVSNVAIKKHCVKLGIELPPQGYWVKR